MSNSSRSGKTELGCITTYGVAQLRAITNEPVSDTDQHQGSLLFNSLNRDKAHRWAALCFTKRFGVSGIVFAPLDVGL